MLLSLALSITDAVLVTRPTTNAVVVACPRRISISNWSRYPRLGADGFDCGNMSAGVCLGDIRGDGAMASSTVGLILT
jgi:hypothetical protein